MTNPRHASDASRLHTRAVFSASPRHAYRAASYGPAIGDFQLAEREAAAVSNAEFVAALDRYFARGGRA